VEYFFFVTHSQSYDSEIPALIDEENYMYDLSTKCGPQISACVIIFLSIPH
jgi:hypothetical protein